MQQIEFTICNLIILVIIVYRFGFANIMLITDRYEKSVITNKNDGFYHVSGFVAMTISAFIMAAMTYRSEFNKYYGAIYILFAVLIMTDCIWEFTLRLTGRSDSLRNGWLFNKLWWLPAFGAAVYFTKDHVHLVTDENLTDAWVVSFYRFAFLITLLNSAVSFWVGRRIYFPFFAFTDSVTGGGWTHARSESSASASKPG
jgi:hypothetical protein